MATSDSLVSSSELATRIYVRLVFLRIGEIDTLNEKYQAQASMESRWTIELEKLLPDLNNDDQKRIVEGKSVSLLNYAQTHWHPQLYIENALGDLKEQIRYTAKRSKHDQQIYICEHRDVKGIFWEKLELYHFPSDVQDLSISIASMLYDDKVLLVKDPYYLSGVNREAFVDQQEWSLYEHVDTQERYAQEFIFDDFSKDEEESNQPLNLSNKAGESSDRKRPIVTITCHAARQSSYFYWNGYFLIFLITAVAFCTFGIPGHQAANRLQITCVLLLASITFRWTVNRSLPTISYLTTMDKYALTCMLILVLLAFWHGVIGALVFLYTPNFSLTSSTNLAYVDRYVFFGSLGIFLVINVAFLIWLFSVPLKHRRHMHQADRQYRLSLAQKKKRNGDQQSGKGIEKLPYERIPIEN